MPANTSNAGNTSNLHNDTTQDCRPALFQPLSGRRPGMREKGTDGSLFRKTAVEGEHFRE
ncbi:MAG: hypothetical protein ACLTW9_01015 [Enterocloster sp.]